MICLTPDGIAASQAAMLKARKPPLTAAHEAARVAVDQPSAKPHDLDDMDLGDRDALLHADDGDEDEPDDDVGTENVATPDMGKSQGGPIPRSLGGKHTRRSDFGVTREHVSLHDVKPAHLVDLHTVGPEYSSASFDENPGHVSVQSLDQAAVSACGPMPGNPSNSPKRPDFFNAPSGHGQSSRTPKRTDGNAAMTPPSGGRVGG